MSNKIWRPPIIFGGRQSVGCTTLFYAYNISQKHRVTERLYLNFTAVSLFKTLPSLSPFFIDVGGLVGLPVGLARLWRDDQVAGWGAARPGFLGQVGGSKGKGGH